MPWGTRRVLPSPTTVLQPPSESAIKDRSELVGELFRILDTDQTGKLSPVQLRRLADLCAFTGDEDEWLREFREMGQSYGAGANAKSMGLDHFTRMVEDNERSLQLSDRELINLISEFSLSPLRAQSVDAIRAEIGGPPIVCIIGRTQDCSSDVEKLVKALATKLPAGLNARASFVTTGLPGVQQIFAESCGESRSHLYHLLHAGQSRGYAAETGKGVKAGATKEEASDVFARVGDIYVAVEGGPEVSSAVATAHTRGAVVVPVAHSAGADSSTAFPSDVLSRPRFAASEHWKLLQQGAAPPEEMAAAVTAILEAFGSGVLLSQLPSEREPEEETQPVTPGQQTPPRASAGTDASATVITRKSGAVYKGQVDKDGLAHGKGIQTWGTGTVYEGDWVHDVMSGRGKLSNPDGSGYTGSWAGNLQHGKGTFVAADKSNYSGQWQHGKMHGEGTYTWPDGAVYNGEFHEGVKSGKGQLRWRSGSLYEGEWLNDKEHGIGMCSASNSKARRGEWVDGQRIRWLPNAAETEQKGSRVAFDIELAPPLDRTANRCADTCCVVS